MNNSSYNCKRILNIGEYYNATNMKSEFCNIQYTSMFYWEPSDMERLEDKGIVKNTFVDWEIRAAAKEAFKDWKEVYKLYGLK